MIDHERKLGKAMLAMAAAAGLAISAPAAADAKSFYSGKSMRFITMGGPGGGFDTYMRTLIPHLEKRLGSTIVPVNESGAGGLLAMNRTINAPPDGATILLTFGESMIGGKLYEAAGARYDLGTLEYIARVSASPKSVMFGPKTPYKTFADMLKAEKPVIWGGSGKTDGNSDFASILSHALDVPARIVVGYKGSRGMLLALERGETDAQVLTDESGLRASKRGPIRVVAILDRDRSKLLPDVPTVYEVAKPTPAQAWWLDWRSNVTAVGRVMVTTPGTPKDRVALLRQVFDEVLHDPAFLAEIKKRRRTIAYLSGEAVEKLVKRTMDSIDDSRIAQIKDVVLRKFYTH